MSIVAVMDQGTSSARMSIFNAEGKRIGFSQKILQAHLPQSGWVEMFPEDIWAATLSTWREALQSAKLDPKDVDALGISNQRETVVVWHRETGLPIYNAIVWQDRRTQKMCDDWGKSIDSETLYHLTGLRLDPYFSASKIAWILDHVDGAREQARRGHLLCGTIDAFIIWRLTKGNVCTTDITNASRTLLFDIHQRCWSEKLLQTFGIDESMLPLVSENTGHLGEVRVKSWQANTPILASMGDQQAALVGQGCTRPGMAKMTYGTGGFLMVNMGGSAAFKQTGLLQTIAHQVNQQCCYAIEGSLFSTGATIRWLRDHMQMIGHDADSELYARSVKDSGGVYLVPAFVGLAAPHWQANARASWVGMSFSTRPEHMVRAALEAVAYQTRELIETLHDHVPAPITSLRVDGGMTNNTWLMQFLANQLGLEVVVAQDQEATTRGIWHLLRCQLEGVSLDDINWQSGGIYHPQIQQSDMHNDWYHAYKNAVKQVVALSKSGL